MKSKLLLITLLFNNLIVQPYQAAELINNRGYKCLESIFFNEAIMTTLMNLDEEDCQGNFNFKEFLETINEDEFLKANQALTDF